MPSALALCVWLLAAAGPAGDRSPEPGLAETAEAAARASGGSASEDLSREVRARRAHWAPQLRGQALLRDDEKSRTGEFRLAPVREIAQIGSCIGREFSYELISAVSSLRDDELKRSLEQLVRSELAYRVGTPPTAGPAPRSSPR